MRYAECCSQPRAADIYYKTNESDEQCRICGETRAFVPTEHNNYKVL